MSTLVVSSKPAHLGSLEHLSPIQSRKFTNSPVRSPISAPPPVNQKLDFGEKYMFQLDVTVMIFSQRNQTKSNKIKQYLTNIKQFHILRRLCERRISSIIGEERTLELLRIPASGNTPKFYSLVPAPGSTKSKGHYSIFLFLFR